MGLCLRAKRNHAGGPLSTIATHTSIDAHAQVIAVRGNRRRKTGVHCVKEALKCCWTPCRRWNVRKRRSEERGKGVQKFYRQWEQLQTLKERFVDRHELRSRLSKRNRERKGISKSLTRSLYASPCRAKRLSSIQTASPV